MAAVLSIGLSAGLESRALAGDAEEFQFGVLLYRGGQYDAALRYLEPLARKDHAKAQVFLGHMHEMGLGQEKNAVKAAEWYMKAESFGEPRAHLAMGRLYETGFGVEKNMRYALRAYHRAAVKDDVDGAFAVARFFMNGIAVSQDMNRAGEWSLLAAGKGHAVAQLVAGVLYFHGNGLPASKARGIALLKLAAAGGEAKAAGWLSKLSASATPEHLAEA